MTALFIALIVYLPIGYAAVIEERLERSRRGFTQETTASGSGGSKWRESDGT